MMIRCSEKHRQECLDYLNSDPVMNLFLIGDIQQYALITVFRRCLSIRTNRCTRCILFIMTDF